MKLEWCLAASSTKHIMHMGDVLNSMKLGLNGGGVQACLAGLVSSAMAQLYKHHLCVVLAHLLAMDAMKSSQEAPPANLSLLLSYCMEASCRAAAELCVDASTLACDHSHVQKSFKHFVASGWARRSADACAVTT